MKKIIYINFQKKFGGGEVYLHFLYKALTELNVNISIMTSKECHYWNELDIPDQAFLYVENNIDSVISSLPNEKIIVMTNGSIQAKWRQKILNDGHKLIGVAHMPLYGRDPHSYDNYDGVIGVSKYVIKSLKDHNVKNIYPNPWYGIADMDRMKLKLDGDQDIFKRSRYSWDMRKGRDRFLSYLEPVYDFFRPKRKYVKKDGITLGIVSSIVPIKQFPLLFKYLSAVIAEYDNITVEIFGSGGYRSVSDLDSALLPIKDRVRFWGHQKNIAAIYSKIDYLITGLPEKEALGLNVIEAQASGIPVIAVNAQPFTETVLHNKTGYLYTDPREDNGASFSLLIESILNQKDKEITPLKYKKHLDNFSSDVFRETIASSLTWLDD